MKRIILMLTVAALMVVALTVTAGPSFARAGTDKPPCQDSNGSKCQVGNNEVKITGNGNCTSSSPGLCTRER
jgi:hypothetical protein